MKFLINKSHLIDAIKISNSIIDTTTTSPFIQGIYIEVKNNILTIIGTNGFISSKIEIKDNIKIVSEGTILIKSKLFFNILQKLSNEEITIEKVDNSVVKIKTKKFDSNINILDDEQYPNINFNYNNWKEIILKPNVFKSIFNKIIHSTSIEKDKPSVLNGVFIESKDNKLHVVATNSIKLSYINFDYEQENDFKVILDTRLINSLSDIVVFDEDIKMYLSSNNIIIKIKNIIFSSKVIEGNYPNIYDVIKSPRDNKIIFNKKEMIDALERGIVVSMVEKKPIVNISFLKDKISLSFKSLEIGSSDEYINTKEFFGNEINFQINASFLISLLKVIDTENVVIYSSKENRPIIITNEKEDNFLQLLLPIRSV